MADKIIKLELLEFECNAIADILYEYSRKLDNIPQKESQITAVSFMLIRNKIIAQMDSQ